MNSNTETEAGDAVLISVASEPQLRVDRGADSEKGQATAAPVYC